MKKILFNDKFSLTAAVLSGRKTQTRRIVKGYVPLGNWIKTYKHSKYQVGEEVAVAQCYNDFYNDECDPRLFPQGAGWTNKLFVKPDQMPHRIRITNVRVERLNEITDADCIAEGIIKGKVGSADTHFMDAYYIPTLPLEPFVTPQRAYAALIDRISGKGTFDSNPWVFVYDFELIK